MNKKLIAILYYGFRIRGTLGQGYKLLGNLPITISGTIPILCNKSVKAICIALFPIIVFINSVSVVVSSSVRRLNRSNPFDSRIL